MNILRDEPAVEPLSEARWRRIESAIFDELDRQPVVAAAEGRPRADLRWAPAWALAACAAAVAIVLVVTQDRGEPAQPSEPSRIVTADSPAQMTVGRSTITVAPASVVWVGGDDTRGVEVILEQGEVACAVAPRAERPPFVVKAGDVRVEVVGTRFVVARDGASARVEVQKGVVHVFHHGERAVLGAGDMWPAPAVPQDPGESAGEPAGAAGEAPRESVRPAGRGHSGVAREVGRERRDGADQALYERAARLEAHDAPAAQALYRKLAEGSGAWSANALFALGRLELELGDAAGARAHLEAYLQRFPGGVNAPDARALLDDL